VPVKIVGVRPGEKLHEELFNEGESVAATVHPKIMRASRPPIDPAWLDDELAELERLVEEGDTLEVVAKLNSMVGAPRLVTGSPSTAAASPRTAQ
jgi:FlaA1/EpsC-like NDP-sugar epimerase